MVSGLLCSCLGTLTPGTLGTYSPVNSVKCVSLRQDDNFFFVKHLSDNS